MANGLLSPVEQQTQSVFGMVPMEERLSLLPRYSKTQGLIAPQFIYELAKAVSTPIVAMRGDYVSPEETLNVPLSGFAGSALGAAPKGALRSFIGRNAKTWNKASEAKFLELEKAGMSPEDIWKQTGTLRGFDGKLRQEISDKSSFLKGTGSYGDVVMNRLTALENAGIKNIGDPITIDDIFYHPELLNAYKNLGKIEAEFTPKGTTAKGRLGDNNLQMQYNLPADKSKSVMLHELQHGIQGIEGFSPGANLQMVTSKDIPAIYLKKAQKLRDQAEKLKDKDMLVEAMKKDAEANKILDLGRFAAYKRTPGEVEARLTQGRINLTDEERRAIFPLLRGKHGVDVNPKKVKGLIE